MASVEEVYRDLGVVHTDDCAICEVDETPRKVVNKVKWIDRVLIGTLLLGIGMVAGMWLTWQPASPLERVYEGYNHIRIYEDGSYEAETREGMRETGCILKAQCND